MNESRGALERQIQQRLQVLANLLPRQEVQLPKSRNPQALRPAQTHDVHHGVSHASHSYASPSPYGPQASATVPPSVDHDALGPMPIWPAPGAPSSPLHLPQGTIARTAGYDQSRSTGAKVEFPTPGRSRAALRRRTTQFDIDASDTSDQGDVEEPKVQTHESSINSPNSSVSASLPDQHSITTQAHGPSVPYNPIKARSSSSAEFSDSFSALQIRAYIESLQVPSSTLDDIEYFMQRLSKGKEIEYDPSDALFRVVSDDTHSLIDIIRITLQRIREGILDDDLVEKRVTFWRRLLHRLTVSLSEVNEQLDAFMLFGYNSEAHPFRLASIPILPPRTLADNIKNALSDCVNLLDKSYNLFIAEMQIVNGGRSIAEAESVSKLTELAFVFIPLSFAASLFSMQVKELNKGVSLYIFVAIALGFVLVAYAVRLGIRSSHLVEYQSKVLLQVRDDSELQYNQPIPTHTFIAWASKAMGYTAWQGIKNFVTVFGPLALLLALIAAMLSPIILLWVREISNGFSAVITVLVLLLDGVLIYPVVTVATGRFEPKGLIRELQKNAEANRKKREEKRKRRKEQSSVDPEAPNVESGSESRNRD
ncbi:hypothetical protein BKA66DRAFT_566639 [Pyrenochaeta sp. MPI-SDFR-AT-0127]|nr:hypothetical protein BKA66DRAFT_566639 [Pyrenochaeta sp. MPI-SDFR-AT-0127]